MAATALSCVIACLHLWAQATERDRPDGSIAMAADDACGAVYRNHILAALLIAEMSFTPQLGRMTMVSGLVLHKANSPIADVFFIENGAVCTCRHL